MWVPALVAPCPPLVAVTFPYSVHYMTPYSHHPSPMLFRVLPFKVPRCQTWQYAATGWERRLQRLWCPFLLTKGTWWDIYCKTSETRLDSAGCFTLSATWGCWLQAPGSCLRSPATPEAAPCWRDHRVWGHWGAGPWSLPRSAGQWASEGETPHLTLAASLGPQPRGVIIK